MAKTLEIKFNFELFYYCIKYLLLIVNIALIITVIGIVIIDSDKIDRKYYPMFLFESILIITFSLMGLISVSKEKFGLIVTYVMFLSLVLIAALIEFDSHDSVAYSLVSAIITLALVYLWLLSKKKILDSAKNLFSHNQQFNDFEENDEEL
jgi:4-amino-4-deoxy-L-arabinose transferase-like glycosyltransferase